MVRNNCKKVFRGVGADALVTLNEDFRFYLTGFASSFGVLITDREGTIFYTDKRYLEAAEKAFFDSDIEVKEYPRKVRLSSLLSSYKSIAMPLSKLTAEDYLSLKNSGFEIVDSTPAFNRAMAVKSGEEIKNISLACAATDRAFCDLLPKIREGMSENDVAAELEYLMRRYGASGTSFETIVAFGENSSVPHHETGLKKLKFGDVVLIDFGCKVNGYCSDCTRTFLFGDDNNHEKFKKYYDLVLQAHMLVKEQFKSGIKGKDGDAIARDFFAKHGLADYFTHSLGHSLGVNIHEFPTLSQSDETVFEDGMVFSDEPGVYLAGEFGIRIEDTVTLEGGKVKSLTDSSKNLIIL